MKERSVKVKPIHTFVLKKDDDYKNELGFEITPRRYNVNSRSFKALEKIGVIPFSENDIGEFSTMFQFVIPLDDYSSILLNSDKSFVHDYENMQVATEEMPYEDYEKDVAEGEIGSWATISGEHTLLGTSLQVKDIEGENVSGYFPDDRELGLIFNKCYLIDKIERIISQAEFVSPMSTSEILNFVNVLESEAEKQEEEIHPLSLTEITEKLLYENAGETDEAAENYRRLTKLIEGKKIFDPKTSGDHQITIDDLLKMKA